MSIFRALTMPVAILAGAAIAVTPADPALAATWTVVATPNASTGQNLFIGVDALSTTDVWAVGRADHSPQQPFVRPFAARWNGGSWAIVGTPTLAGQLSGVDGSAADNVWAVGAREVALGGGTFTFGPLAEQWNGTSWSVVPTPTPSGTVSTTLSGVKTFSATNAWAVGTAVTAGTLVSKTLIQQWNGTNWKIDASPSPDPNQNLLTDIDGASADDVWAVGNLGSDGYGGTVAGLVLHYDGTSWSEVKVPGIVSDGTFNVPTLQDVVALSANDVWIVGRVFSWIDLRIVPLALHWNGLTWQRTVMSTAPNDGQGFQSVAALSATKVYAFGSVIARWTGTGWVAESATVPGQLIDAAAAGTSTVWSVGYRYDPNLAQLRTLGMRTTNG
ncbi:MAG TPA: hypothetical protein VFC19_02155 [Candidatus Limnocylindrales bacterium]|nr:hypothetical protein [Candidatus Limnocylindrales bacterium]